MPNLVTKISVVQKTCQGHSFKKIEPDDNELADSNPVSTKLATTFVMIQHTKSGTKDWTSEEKVQKTGSEPVILTLKTATLTFLHDSLYTNDEPAYQVGLLKAQRFSKTHEDSTL